MSELDGRSDDGSQSGDESGSGSSVDAPELMVHGRDKRVTAGNKLHSLLSGQADLEEDEIFVEAEDDVEFDSNEEGDDDEMDESSEEDETALEPEDAGEQELRRQQKVERQVERKKRSAAQVFAQPRQPATPKEPKPKKDRRSTSRLPEATRRSSRAHAVQTAEVVESKLQEAERRKSQMTVKIRPKEREMTQEERMAESKETEERNRSSLRQIFELEEQRLVKQRKQAEKRKMHGPMVRWISRASMVDGTKVAQNFVILETFDENMITKRVLFDSVDELPAAKKRLVCPITGARAKYRDPKTGCGYVTSEDYGEIRKLADGRYRWSSHGFAVEAGDERVVAKGVPLGF